MSKVLNVIKAQIKRDGELPEHLEVLKLYNFMVNNKLSSKLMWNEITKFTYSPCSYSIKPEFSKLIKHMNT